jgi:hypothetical protein
MSDQAEIPAEKPHDSQSPHPLEQGLDVYPLRDASEDPRWAVRTVWTWISIAISLLVFFIVLLILGLWYD